MVLAWMMWELVKVRHDGAAVVGGQLSYHVMSSWEADGQYLQHLLEFTR